MNYEELMETRDNPQKILEISENPRILKTLDPNELEILVTQARCICLIRKSPGYEECGLSGERRDGSNCGEGVITCPELMNLMQDPQGQIVSSFNQGYFPKAIKFYEALSRISEVGNKKK